MSTPLFVQFAGGSVGEWCVEAARVIAGVGLASVTHVAIHEHREPIPATWVLRAVTSNQRYVERVEGTSLRLKQASLGRAEASCAALLPIMKSAAWWELAQDERRAIFEDRSQHIAATLRYLPAIARRLHHSRDLGEPFDFVTWFEFAPEHTGLFDDLLGMLRGTEEWDYVERELEFRLALDLAAKPS